MDPDTFQAALEAGTSGIRLLDGYQDSPLRCRIAGTILAYDTKAYIPSTMKDARKAVSRLARTVQFGVTAAQQAMTRGGPKPDQIDPFRFGIEYACIMVSTEVEDVAPGARLSTQGLPPGEVNISTWGDQGLKLVPPLWMLKYLPNMAACHASINSNAQGPNNSHTPTDIAGTLALGEALRILQRGGADFFLVGGCESRLNPLSLSRADLFMELTSQHHDTPSQAVRPYDAGRSGTVLGEGAAVLGLEERDFAQKRGASILAEVAGFACGFDPRKEGKVFAQIIRRALQEAGITPEQVDHINAAAGGWTRLDAWEAGVIAEVFGGQVPVFAAKGHLGNAGAASGLIELAATIQALARGQLPGTLNHTVADPNCPITVHTGAPRAITKPYAVKLSLTDMGHCAAVVLKQWQGSGD
jgi:3-oxoacyl-[acyl-carrier-protein] synthase II